MTEWRRCRGCDKPIDPAQFKAAHRVCPICGDHGRWPVRERFDALLDEASFEAHDGELTSNDPIEWVAQGQAYTESLTKAEARAGTRESFVSGRATIEGLPVWVGAFEFRYLGGTLGTVAGEKIARLTDRAIAARQPVVIWTASGGARMQEGMFSLLQMAKIATQIAALQAAGVPLITVICDPTTGGVAASLALRGDVVLAEPGALVGFSGPRVVRQTIGEEMPPGIQLTDRLHRDGFVDEIVPRDRQRRRLAAVLERFDT